MVAGVRLIQDWSSFASRAFPSFGTFAWALATFPQGLLLEHQGSSWLLPSSRRALGTRLRLLAQRLSPLPGCKLGEGRDSLIAVLAWMESSATPGTWEVFNKHFVFVSFLTKCE